MDFESIFSRRVTVEESNDGSKVRVSVTGLKEETTDGRTTSTIFGQGADENQARASLAENIVAAAKDAAKKVYFKIGPHEPKQTITASGNTISLA